jgi:hypothetical protein
MTFRISAPPGGWPAQPQKLTPAQVSRLAAHLRGKMLALGVKLPASCFPPGEAPPEGHPASPGDVSGPTAPQPPSATSTPATSLPPVLSPSQSSALASKLRAGMLARGLKLPASCFPPGEAPRESQAAGSAGAPDLAGESDTKLDEPL